MKNYPYEETILSVLDEIELWNWKTKRFDEPGTPFEFDNHVNDMYYNKEEVRYINDVINCGDNHFLATVIEGDCSDDPFIFSPGYHFVNRIGYVVYKAEDKLPQDYWI